MAGTLTGAGRHAGGSATSGRSSATAITRAPGGWLLDIEAMSVALGPQGRRVTVVDEVSLQIGPGRIVCVVGESGSGKSVFAMSLMRLLSDDICSISAGRALFEGEELTGLGERDMLRLRGARMAMIFQEPMTSLNPVFTIGDQIAEAVRLHQKLSPKAARQKVLAALRQVHIPAPERRFDAYPHELSGGMRQRVMIAMALACEPSLLIADEPTTALDVTIQAQILALLTELRDRTGLGILFITHNLGVVAEIADDVAVMYAGRIVERAPAAALFADAQHPYTLALLAAMPRLDNAAERLEPIPGRMPPPSEVAEGCGFAPRCPFAAAECNARPTLRRVGDHHDVACWRAPIEDVA
jgi:peptide/nickel transport system ATP-binding protein